MNLDAIKSYIKKYPVGSAASVTTLVALGLFVYRHMGMTEMQGVYETASAEGQKLAANVTHASQLDEQYRALEEVNKTIASRLVNPLDLALNLQYFYKLEADTGVKLLDTRPVDVKAVGKAAAVKGAYTPVQYILSLQGRHTQILAFLRKLEHGTFFCRVISGSCSQSQSDQEKSGGDVVMSLTVELLGRS